MVQNYKRGQIIFSQGDPANTVFYIREGRVKLSVVSKQGKEAVVGILGVGDVFGDGCLADQPLRLVIATAITPCSLLRIGKKRITQLFHRNRAFSDHFMSHIIAGKIRILDDLVDRMFNPIEKRLARTLLVLAKDGEEEKAETVIPKISQGTLADIIGATRSRVNIVMNKFKRLGFIEYNGGIKVRRSLLNMVLQDEAVSSKAP
jgi:CRP/FNR family cyclic AMP-dependent transcriptional regulator